MDIFKEFGDVEISFDADRDYTNLDSMIKYSKKLEEKLKQVEEKIDELSWDGALNRAEEKLKQVESERDKYKKQARHVEPTKVINNELAEKLHTLEEIARGGLSIYDKGPLTMANRYLKKIDEIMGNN